MRGKIKFWAVILTAAVLVVFPAEPVYCDMGVPHEQAEQLNALAAQGVDPQQAFNMVFGWNDSSSNTASGMACPVSTSANHSATSRLQNSTWRLLGCQPEKSPGWSGRSASKGLNSCVSLLYT